MAESGILTEHGFHLLQMKLRAESLTNQQQPKTVAVKARKSILQEEACHLMVPVGFRLETLIVKLFYCSKCLKNAVLIIFLVCPVTFESAKRLFKYL